jgi:hypothetical protein
MIYNFIRGFGRLLELPFRCFLPQTKFDHWTTLDKKPLYTNPKSDLDVVTSDLDVVASDGQVIAEDFNKVIKIKEEPEQI